MKVVCPIDKLKEGINCVERVSNKNLPLAILSAVYIIVEKNHLIIKSTNLELGVEYTIPVKVESMGSCAVPNLVFSNFINNIKLSNTITLELIGTQLHLVSERQSTIIKTVPHEDFPLIPRIDNKNIIGTFTIKGKLLSEGLRSVTFAASNSDIKPEIAAVFIEEDGKNINFVATDMFRLAKKTIPYKDKEVEDSDILIPIKNAIEITKIVEGVDLIDVVYSKTDCVLSSDNIYIYSRLVNGKFLDYNQAIPTKIVTTALILKEELVSTIRASSVFADKFHLVHIKVMPEESVFEVTSRNQDTGESVILLESRLTGEAVDLNFNARFILDALNAIESQTIELNFAGKDKPMLIKGADENSFIYVIAPLNR